MAKENLAHLEVTCVWQEEREMTGKRERLERVKWLKFG